MGLQCADGEVEGGGFVEDMAEGWGRGVGVGECLWVEEGEGWGERWEVSVGDNEVGGFFRGEGGRWYGVMLDEGFDAGMDS